MFFLSNKSLPKSAAFLFLVFSIFTWSASAQSDFKTPKGLVRQQAAINKLSDRLPAVAQKYGKTSEQLRQLLLEDPTLYIDAGDRLLYIDPVVEKPEDASADESSPTALDGPFPNSQTFALHSRPGSNRVIYLDFNGHVTSGTLWNTNFTGGQTINSAPFSIDGDPSTFNQQEQDVIQYIWQRVAEDYAPFDVDVTTEDPGADAIIRYSASDQTYGARAVISPTNFVGSIGGIAYLGVFNYYGSEFKPAFVMSANLGNNEKSIAEATSHEIGHNLNLEHDGAPGTGYYTGHGDWAPIMGAGYYRSVSQWSRGEYPGANNTQDDLAIMQNYGIALIADDHADTTGNATVLNGGNISASGLITTRNDADFFRFSIGSGNVSINVNPAPRGANLDIQAQILNAQGSVVATSNPSGLAAGFNQFLNGGVYYLRIEGVGAGDLSSGYSDYASIGQYSITGTLPGGSSGGQVPIAAISVTTASGTAPLTVGFSSVNSSDPDGSIVGYSWNFGDGTSSTNPNPVKVYNSVGTYTAVLTVTDNSGLTDSESVVITAQPPTATYSLVASPNSTYPNGLVAISWTAPSGSSSLDYIGFYRVGSPNKEYRWSRYTNGATSGTFTFNAKVEAGQYEFRYLLNNGLTSVQTSNVISIVDGVPRSNETGTENSDDLTGGGDGQARFTLDLNKPVNLSLPMPIF